MKNKRFLAKILITSLLVTSLFWPRKSNNAEAAVETFDLSTRSNANFIESTNELEIEEQEDQITAYSGEDNIIDSGACGKSLTWTLYNNGVLIISGSGAMDNWQDGYTPWRASAYDPHTVIIKEGVTSAL